jgi:hypothetical protein
VPSAQDSLFSVKDAINLGKENTKGRNEFFDILITTVYSTVITLSALDRTEAVLNPKFELSHFSIQLIDLRLQFRSSIGFITALSSQLLESRPQVFSLNRSVTRV